MKNPIDAWSFSRLQCYEECPAKFRYRNIDKLPEPKGDALLRGIKIHGIAETYLKGKDPDELPPALETFDGQFQELHALTPMVEQKWAFTSTWKPTGFFAKGPQAAWLRVVPDAAVLYDDAAAEVIDFKTGKVYGENADQVELFALATFAKFSHVNEVTTRLWYLDDGTEKIGEFVRDSAAIKETKEEWVERTAPMFNDTTFAPRPSNKCRWCAFSRSAGGPCAF